MKSAQSVRPTVIQGVYQRKTYLKLVSILCLKRDALVVRGLRGTVKIQRMIEEYIQKPKGYDRKSSFVDKCVSFVRRRRNFFI